jgi:hypothetical protein
MGGSRSDAFFQKDYPIFSLSFVVSSRDGANMKGCTALEVSTQED